MELHQQNYQNLSAGILRAGRRTEPMNSMVKSLISLGGAPISSPSGTQTFGVELASGDRVFVMPLQGGPESPDRVNAVMTVRKKNLPDFYREVDRRSQADLNAAWIGDHELEDLVIFELDGLDERMITQSDIKVTTKGLEVDITADLGRGVTTKMQSIKAIPPGVLTMDTNWIDARLEEMRERKQSQMKRAM